MRSMYVCLNLKDFQMWHPSHPSSASLGVLRIPSTTTKTIHNGQRDSPNVPNATEIGILVPHRGQVQLMALQLPNDINAGQDNLRQIWANSKTKNSPTRVGVSSQF